MIDLNEVEFQLLDESHLDALVTLDSDPEIMRYINGGRAQPAWLYKDFLLPAYISITDKNPGMGCYAIKHASMKDMLGICLLRPDFERPDWCEIGYRLARASWGFGLGTFAANDMIRRALKLPDVDVICARIETANIASRRVIEKCGLQLDSEFQFKERQYAEGRWIIPSAAAVLYTSDRAKLTQSNA